MSPLDILFVDSSSLFHRIVSQIFAATRLQLRFAASGSAALDLLREGDFALVCGAYHLPDMSGIELCRRLRGDTKTPYTPFVLLTSDQLDDVQAEAYAAGVTDIIEKQSLDQLVGFVQRVLSHHEPMAGQVLVVEDTAAQGAYYAGVLAQNGLTVRVVRSAEEALGALAGSDFDLVVLDVVPAGPMSGMGLARHSGATPCVSARFSSTSAPTPSNLPKQAASPSLRERWRKHRPSP